MKRVLIHYIDNSLGRGFLSEMQCIIIAHSYALANDMEFLVDDTRGPMYFSLGFGHYFNVGTCNDNELIGGQWDVLTTGRPRGLPKLDTTRIGIWNMLAFLEENVSPRARRDCLRTLFTFQPHIKSKIDRGIQRANLTKPFACVHIRRGDKELDGPEMGNTYDVATYAEKVMSLNAGFKSLFVCTDNYKVVEQMREHLASSGYGLEVRSLARKKTRGFDFKKLYAAQSEFSEQDVVDLLIDVSIAARSDLFVGTHSSNFFKVVKQLHNKPDQCLSVGW